MNEQKDAVLDEQDYISYDGGKVNTTLDTAYPFHFYRGSLFNI